MQLRTVFATICIAGVQCLFAQELKTDNEEFKNALPVKYRVGEVSVDLLNSYYQQDGDHSAVEGGIGSQSLNDVVATVIVSIPVDSVNIIGVTTSWDTYSSASSRKTYYDFIGRYDTQSSASIGKTDTRQSGNLSYSRLTKKAGIFTLGGGYSNEYDVKSLSAKASWEIESEDKNRTFNVSLGGIFDTWKMLYPGDVSGYAQTSYYIYDSKDKRNTYSVGLHYSFIVNKKFQASINYESVLQKGILATPFQRFFFNKPAGFDPLAPAQLVNYSDRIKADFGFNNDPSVDYNYIITAERLPRERWRNALALRTAWFATPDVVVRGYYRYYMDNHDITAHSASIEVPYKPSRFFSIYPFYRFHTQTASKYFYPFAGLELYSADYFTSDYDLSAFQSNEVGLGVRISPAAGILRKADFPLRNRTSSFKSINIRGAYYAQSSGLKSFIVSSVLNFVF